MITKKKITNNLNLSSYHKVHDSIISLPIPIYNRGRFLEDIKSILLGYIKENKVEKNSMV